MLGHNQAFSTPVSKLPYYSLSILRIPKTDVSPLRYAVNEGKTNKYLAYGVGGLGVVAAVCAGAYYYYSTRTGGPVESSLPINDLPAHSTPQER
jgi:hypothetical protein